MLHALLTQFPGSCAPVVLLPGGHELWSPLSIWMDEANRAASAAARVVEFPWMCYYLPNVLQKNYHIAETLIIKHYTFWSITVVNFRKRVTWSSDLTSCITQKTLLCCYGNSASATQRSSLRQQPQIRQVTSAFVCTEFVSIILQHKLNQPPRLLALRGVCYWNARPKVCLREYLHKANIWESGLNLSVKSAKTFLFT